MKNGNPHGIDGWWEVLQDWSTCTLKCGGGTQTLHKKCHPPLEGGEPCQGESIETRECNKEPCLDDPPVATEDDLPLQVKIMKVSDRPQRYETCIIKEGDLEVVREDMV